MEITQIQRQETKLILTQTMRQSLAILRMPLWELRDYLQNATLDNPLLDLAEGEEGSEQDILFRDIWDSPDKLLEWRSSSGNLPLENLGGTTEEDFTEMLREQLLELQGEKKKLVSLCTYLIYCLDERGYLPFALDALAQEQKVTLEEMEAALQLMQNLEPAGVGARSLQECLALQAQRTHLGPDVLRLINEGLHLLAQNDYKALENLLQLKRKQVEQLVARIHQLNPIPSQGFKTDNLIEYHVPEAEVKVENRGLVVELNFSFVPKLRLNNEVEKLLQTSKEVQCQDYMKQQLMAARELMNSVTSRENTLYKLLKTLVEKQAPHFLAGAPLAAYTMSQLAMDIGVSNSTISRAIQGKTIVFRGHIIALKDLFTVGIVQGELVVASASVKEKLRSLVKGENPINPLSDEELSKLLVEAQLTVSRRTVAKYREELGIAASGKRRRK